jgi:hypothetical protein
MCLQAIFHDSNDVLGGWNHVSEFRHIGVQVLVIEIAQDLLAHQPVQNLYVYHLSARGIHRTGDAYIQHIVMPVPVGIVAFPVQLAILFF